MNFVERLEIGKNLKGRFEYLLKELGLRLVGDCDGLPKVKRGRPDKIGEPIQEINKFIKDLELLRKEFEDG